MGVATAIRRMIASGLTIDQALMAAEILEAEMEPRRSSAAVRQQRYRERHSDVTSRNSDAASSPDKESSPTPPKEINPSSTLASLAVRSVRARDLRAEFDQFWKPYPNKVGKPAALRAFGKVRKQHELGVILFGVDRYIAEKPPDRPWLNPATFLNQERFNDQPASPPVANGKSRPHDTILRAIAEQFAPGNGMGGGQADPDVGLHDDGGRPSPDREFDFDLPKADYRRS